jgi:hypothetical protein
MPPKAKKREQKQQEKESEESIKSEGEEEEDDDGEEKSENIDSKFRLNKPVNIYVTLPSGDEEIILNYDMCFCDKQAYQNYKENGHHGYQQGFGELSQLEAGKNGYSKDAHSNEQDSTGN